MSLLTTIMVVLLDYGEIRRILILTEVSFFPPLAGELRYMIHAAQVNAFTKTSIIYFSI